MPELADPSSLQRQVTEVKERLAESRRVWIASTAGTAPGLLLAGLAAELKGAVCVRLPPLADVDAPIHGLLQSASPLGREPIETSMESAQPMGARARQIARSLAEQGALLLVGVPASWQFGRTFEDPLDQLRSQQAQELLEGWLSVEELPVVLVTSRAFRPNRSMPRKVELALATPRLEVLEDQQGWGPYASAALEVQRQVREARLRPTPLQLRLMVGLVALGVSAEELGQDLAWESTGPTPDALGLLAGRLVEALSRVEHQPLRRSVMRLARARYPLPLEEALELASLPAGHETLLTECLGQQWAGSLVLLEPVRHALWREFAREAPAAEVHLRLARIHERLDGVLDPAEASYSQMLHWLEKVHHLGHAGPEAQALWDQQVLRSPHFYWDRARSLSVEHRDYLGAAALYEACLARFPEDSYSWHYLGFNLDKAGVRAAKAEAALREAVRVEPENPWWNSRLVTFLINQGLVVEARREWLAALERLDPERERIQHDVWLASHVHYWVASAWLEHGEVERAEEVFRSIPREMVRQEERLRQLELRVEDAREARELGESVYPAWTPLRERWKRPRFGGETSPSGARRRAWYPGRVREASDKGVDLVLATTEADPRARRVILRHLSPEEWRQSGWGAAQEAEGFVEVHVYEDGSFKVHQVPAYRSDSWSEHAEEDELRYLRSWAPA